MGNDTLMTEVENGQVYQGEKQTEQDENEASETRLGGKSEVQPKADMNDMAAISSLTPRLENQQVSKTRTENNSELKKSTKGINLVRDTGRDLRMRGPSKAGSNMNLFVHASSSNVTSPPKQPQSYPQKPRTTSQKAG